MNANEFKISKTFSAPREVVFKYFIRPELIEQWSAPDGMTLRVSQFDAKVGGHYRYEHTAENGGKYLCEGRITDLVLNEKLVQFDEYISAPDGKRLGEGIENFITFKDTIGGTEVTVETKGNFDDQFKQECETGWTQCFGHLVNLIAKETGAGYSGKAGEVRPNI